MKENILSIIVEVIAGKYIQLKNLVIEIEYNYFISGLFKSVDLDEYRLEFSSNLHLVSLKVGF